MKWMLNNENFDNKFLERVEKISGQKVSACYQCGKCSAGCPVCQEMDLAPNQIIRMLQLGMKDKVIKNRTIWLCASCQTCSIRCPQMIDLAKVMETLRIISQKEVYEFSKDWRLLFRNFWDRVKVSMVYIFQMDVGSNLQCFNKIFLESVHYYGRMFEPTLIYNYNINSGYLFSNFLKAPIMFLKSKIKLLPSEVKRVDRVQRIFEEVKRLEEEEK